MTRSILLAATLLAALAFVASGCSDTGGASEPVGDAAGVATTESAVQGPRTSGPMPPPDEPVAFDPAGTTVAPASEPLGRTVQATIETEDGRVRSYRTYVPASVDASPGSTPVPLLLAFHGGGGWGAQFETNSGFDGLAESNRFLVVYPDGTGAAADGSGIRTWNGGACCGRAAAAALDDVGFVDQLLDVLEATYAIDPDRVVAAGHSNGGILSYRLACELSDRIVAIGVQSSALEVDDCRPTSPVSVLHLHGTADQNLPITGGRGPQSASGVDYSVPIEGAGTVATENGCGPASGPTVADGRDDLVVTTWPGCDDDVAGTFVEVSGASHAWMGSSIATGRGGEPYADLDSSLQIWDFLSRHPRR